MADTALFVIDVQHGLAEDPATRIPNADSVNTAVEQILAAARRPEAVAAKTPAVLVFVQHEEPAEAQDSLSRGSQAWQLVFPPDTTTTPEREWLVAKTTQDTFVSNPKLADQLRAKGISKIVVSGVQSDFCVRSTSRGALAAGLAVTVLQGAHGTYGSDDPTKKSAEEVSKEVEGELEAEGATIRPWKDYLDSL